MAGGFLLRPNCIGSIKKSYSAKAGMALGWQPKVGVEEGIKMLFAWVEGNRGGV